MADQEGHVSPQVVDAMTTTNVKSWHDVHMGIAASMAESHTTTMAALNQTFASTMGSLQKRIVEPDVSQAISERLIGGAGQSAIQSDQVSALANNLAQLVTQFADMKVILNAIAAKP
jgi:hypothetical protein